MGRNVLETVLGAVVLAVAGFFLVFVYTQANLGTVKGYEIGASFADLGGLEDGGDVRINGIKVGTVLSQHIDPQSFDAMIRMSISPTVRIPADTVATVDSDGLLGGKYVRLIPGHSRTMIDPGGSITHTRNYRSLEQMVGDIIFLATDNGAGTGSSTGKPVNAGQPSR